MKNLFLFFTLVILPAFVYTYSTPLALELAYMSDIAYENSYNINAWNCSECKKYKFSNVKTFFSSDKSIQGFTGYSSSLNAIIVSFRGSDNINNWISNINTIQVSYSGCSGCQVHQGFYSAYNSVGHFVRGEVSSLKALFRNSEVMITGHSLGGALAAFASIDIHKNIAVVSQVYTFGQPRIGNSNMAKFMVGAIPNTYRVIDYADIVPHLPPGVFNFLHYGHEVWYSPRGMQSYKICASEDSNCADSISITSLSTDDHSISHYLKLKVVSNFYSWFSGMLNYHLRKETDWETVQRQEARKVEEVLNKLKEEQKIQIDKQ